MVMGYCDKCVYRKTFTSAGPYCDYLCMTNERRPCPPGEGCTVRVIQDARKPKAFTVSKAKLGRPPMTEEERAAAELARQEKRREYDRERYRNQTEEDREKGREKSRRYYERNKEKYSARHSAWYQANKERAAAYQRERRRKKREAEQNGCSPE